MVLNLSIDDRISVLSKSYRVPRSKVYDFYFGMFDFISDTSYQVYLSDDLISQESFRLTELFCKSYSKIR